MRTDTWIYNLCNERGRAIWQFVVKKNKLMSVFNINDCPVIDYGICHNIVKVVCGSTRLSPCGSPASLTMLWWNSWSNFRTDTWKTDVNLLNLLEGRLDPEGDSCLNLLHGNEVVEIWAPSFRLLPSMTLFSFFPPLFDSILADRSHIYSCKHWISGHVWVDR